MRCLCFGRRVTLFRLFGFEVRLDASWLIIAALLAAAVGGGFGIVLMLFAVWQWFAGNFVGAMWYFLIGLFLRGAAQASYQQLTIRAALEGEPVRRFMNAHPVPVPSNISLEELVNDYVYRYHHKMFPVLNASEKLAGCVTTSQVKAYPRDEWSRHSVQEVLQPCTPDNTLTPDADAVKALSKMKNSGLSRLMVVEGDRLVGIIALKDLLGLLAAKVDLEGEGFRHYKPAHSRILDLRPHRMKTGSCPNRIGTPVRRWYS